MKKAALLLLFLAAPAALADPPQLSVPAEVAAQPGDWLVVVPNTTAKAVAYVGLDGLSSFPSAELKDPRKLVLNPQKEGRYRFIAIGSLNDELALAHFTVVVGTPPAPTPGPTPGPGPSPDPFGHQVVAGPNSGSFRVLVVYDSRKLSSLPQSQLDVLTSSDLRNYLNSHCGNGPDGVTKEWRLWDQGVDLTAASPPWQAAMKRPRTTLPWVVIGNGKAGYEGPLPATVADTLALFKKYAGS